MDAGSREVPDGVLPPGVGAEIEAWFARMGVPQLIDDFTTERRMDARARVLVLIWIVGGSLLWWGNRPESSLGWKLLGGAAVVASVATGLAAVRWLRNKVMWWQDRDLDVFDTFSLGPLVAIPSGIIEGSWQAGLRAGLDTLIGMGAIYLVVGLGVGEIAWWSLKRLRDEFAHIVTLLARTLPILLILVLFLLFASELWEAAHQLRTAEFWLVVGMLALVAVLLLLTTFRVEFRTFRATPPDELRRLAETTPIGPFVAALPPPSMPPLRVLQRINTSVLVVIGQLIQSTFVALVVAGFLVVFGLVVLPADLQERWVGEPLRVIASFDMLGETRHLTGQLIITSSLLGSVVGLYFTGLAVTESAYRAAHFDRILDEARQVLAAHAVYWTALHHSSGPEPE